MDDKCDSLLDVDIGLGTARRVLKLGYAIGDRLGRLVDEPGNSDGRRRPTARQPDRHYGNVGSGKFRYDDF